MGPAGPRLIGFSGGGDSLALLLHQRALGKVHALIVDHALREGSQQAAEAAAELAKRHGAEPEIVRLHWAQRKTAQADWRRARLAALCAAARRLGVTEFALGHTADDQAETLAMRLAAQSGWRGLAGMAACAPAAIWPEGRGIWVIRPLLDARRAELRHRLADQGASWLEDGANRDARFARVRARARLSREPDLHAHLLALASEAARAAEALDRAVCSALGEVVVIEAGRMRLRARALARLAQPVQTRLLASALCAVSGAEHPCSEDKAAQILHRLHAGERFCAAGLAMRHEGEDMLLLRDPGAVNGRGRDPRPKIIALAPGEVQIWDNRLECRSAEPGWCIAPGPNGQSLAIFSGLGQMPDQSHAPAMRWLIQERLDALLWRARK